MNSDKLNNLTKKELEARKAELEAMPALGFPENLELEIIKQTLDSNYRPKPYIPKPK